MSDFAHTVTPDGYSNLYGYGIPDLNKALGLNINRDDLQKLKESEYNNNVSLNALNALEAWKAGYTGSGVKVGIMDGGAGLDTEIADHEFSSVYIWPYGLADGSHGFRVAQYIVAKNHLPESVGGNGEKSETGSEAERDVTGVAFDAELYFIDPEFPTRNMDELPEWTTEFEWFFENEVDIIHLSFYASFPGLDNPMTRMFKLAQDKGIIIVMSAGNSGIGMDAHRSNEHNLGFALAFDNVIISSALSPGYPIELYDFSNHAGDVEHNHFAIVEDYSHAYYPSGEYETNISGTSFSAPYLTGAVALIIQKLRGEGKYDFENDYKQVIDILKETSSILDREVEVLNRNIFETELGATILGNQEANEWDVLIVNAKREDIDWNFVSIEIGNPNTDYEYSRIKFEKERFEVIHMEEIRFSDGNVNTGDYILIREKDSKFAREAIEIIVSVDEEYLNEQNIGYVINLLENNSEDEMLSLISNTLNLSIVELIQKQYENLYEESISEIHIVNIIEFSGRTNSEFFWDVVRGDVMEEYVTDNRLGYIGQTGDLILYQDFDM